MTTISRSHHVNSFDISSAQYKKTLTQAACMREVGRFIVLDTQYTKTVTQNRTL